MTTRRVSELLDIILDNPWSKVFAFVAVICVTMSKGCINQTVAEIPQIASIKQDLSAVQRDIGNAQLQLQNQDQTVEKLEALMQQSIDNTTKLQTQMGSIQAHLDDAATGVQELNHRVDSLLARDALNRQ